MKIVLAFYPALRFNEGRFEGEEPEAEERMRQMNATNNRVGEIVKVGWLGNWTYAMILKSKAGALLCIDKHGGRSINWSDRVISENQLTLMGESQSKIESARHEIVNSLFS